MKTRTMWDLLLEAVENGGHVHHCAKETYQVFTRILVQDRCAHVPDDLSEAFSPEDANVQRSQTLIAEAIGCHARDVCWAAQNALSMAILHRAFVRDNEPIEGVIRLAAEDIGAISAWVIDTALNADQARVTPERIAEAFAHVVEHSDLVGPSNHGFYRRPSSSCGECTLWTEEANRDIVALATHHEAGHAAARVLLGLPLREATIEHIHYYGCMPVDPHTSIEPRNRSEARNEIITMFAGFEAERLIDPGTPDGDLSSEVHRARGLSLDWHILPDGLRRKGSDAHRRFLGRFQTEAHRLMKGNLDLVRAIAGAFDGRMYLPTAEVMELASSYRRDYRG